MANASVIGALEVLKDLNEKGRRTVPEHAPTSFVKGRWEKHVLLDETIERHAYENSTPPSQNCEVGCDREMSGYKEVRPYKAFEEYLMSPGQWQWLKHTKDTGMEVAEDVSNYLTERRETLSGKLTTVEKLLTEEKLPDVRLVKGALVITPLAKAVPDDVEALTRQAYALLPRIKLPELFLEVSAWTGLDRHFTHLHTGEVPKDRTALFATLLADAINLGLSQMAGTSEGMTFNRLAWIADWNVRDETYTKALAEVINYHHRVPFAAYWGDGTTSSSDGQRFKAGRPEATAQVNLRYGTEPGVTFYTHLSDQYGPYNVKVISSSVRDAPHMVDGLLYHETDLPIHEHYTDTWGYTDQVFGMTHLLSFRFAPRIRDLGDKRIYSFEKPETYTKL